MQRIICLAPFVSVMSAVAYGQSTEDAVAVALLAAPPAMQGEAMAIRLDADGDHEVLRDGTNGLVCWDRSDEPQRSFSVQCTSVENLPRVKQNRAWAMSGKSADEIRVIRDAAEADGSREVSKFGSTYYTLAGQDQASATLRHHDRGALCDERFRRVAERGELHTGWYVDHGGWHLGRSHHGPRSVTLATVLAWCVR